jgi:hypothetical protein
VMIETVIIPSLCPQFGQKALHSVSSGMATEVGHEANIGFSLQAYYRVWGSAQMAMHLARLPERIDVRSSYRHPAMRT